MDKYIVQCKAEKNASTGNMLTLKPCFLLLLAEIMNPFLSILFLPGRRLFGSMRILLYQLAVAFFFKKVFLLLPHEYINGRNHRLGLFGLHVHSCSHWLRPNNPSPPPIPRIWAHI
jgi:hypothetical protein